MRRVGEQTFLQYLKSYVGFTDDSSAVLGRLHPIVAPHYGRIIDDFYATIEAHPGARTAITEGAPQIERLKKTLLRWLEELFVGPHDETYFQRRARIGRVHVRISLPQAYMFTAMNRIRVHVEEVLQEALANDLPARQRAMQAVHQIMDIELAIMLETYREDLLTKNRTAERLATIGQFAASIGHELRNPLGVIESSAFLMKQHLERQPAPEPKLVRHLDKITAEVKRSNKTINDLLELARNKPLQLRATRVDELLAAATASANLPGTVAVEQDVPAGLTAAVDGDQLGRVLSNLMLNASQAMAGQGTIWLSAEHAPGRTNIRVRDSGPGVPVDIRHRIFEALFTTKARGSGLGLALCRRILDAHGGSIALEPTGPGASFLVTIPDGQEPA
jgi:two-component system, NtrC family, sensor histidine kinase HydH